MKKNSKALFTSRAVFGTLVDKESDSKKKIDVEVEISNGSILIKHKGYGDASGGTK